MRNWCKLFRFLWLVPLLPWHLWRPFFQAKRRESVLSHFPSHIGSHFRDLFSGSSFKGPHVFIDEVLTKVLAVSANLALVKAVSFPVFGAAKSGRKASSDQSLAAATSAAASRGRGRGSVSDQSKKSHPSSPAFSSSFQGRKRKASSPSSGRSVKSPHRGAKSSRGKGFRK